MSRKAASWAAAALTLFATLLLGAVLIRPILAEPDNASTVSPSDGVTVLRIPAPVVGEVGSDNNHGFWFEDEHEEDNERYDD
jgi:hypothetical protein